MSRLFSIVMVTLIIASCISIGLAVDYSERTDESRTAFSVLEHFFTWAFVLEAILKIVAFTPCEYFTSSWDVFDFIVAFLSAITLVVSMATHSSGNEGGLSRVIRVFRLLRVTRIARTAHFFNELHSLMSGLAASLSGLFWAFMLLLMLIYAYALVFTEVVGKDNIWDGRPEEEDIRAFYGTVPRSMYSLFQIMSLESWSMALARPVWEV